MWIYIFFPSMIQYIGAIWFYSHIDAIPFLIYTNTKAKRMLINFELRTRIYE